MSAPTPPQPAPETQTDHREFVAHGLTPPAPDRHEGSRAAFEAAYGTACPTDCFERSRQHTERYLFQDIQSAWLGWQCALDHAAQEQPAPEPTQGSAREWVEQNAEGDLAVGWSGRETITRYLPIKDALELADRADAAERRLAEVTKELLETKLPEYDRCETCNTELGPFGPLGVDGEPTTDCIVCILRAQLAAAQPAPEPTQGSAREWVKAHSHDGSAEPFFSWVYESAALELADRADDAERQAISMRQKADAFERAGHDLKAQLTEAQTMFRHHNDQLADEQNQFGLLRGELHSTKAQLAAAQAEAEPTQGSAREWVGTIRHLECYDEYWITVERALELADRADAAERRLKVAEMVINGYDDRMRNGCAQLAAAQAEAGKLREALRPLLVAIYEMKHDSTNGDYELPTLAKLDFAAVLAGASKARAALTPNSTEQ